MPRLLVDTNVLLLHVIGSWDRGQITRFKRTRSFTSDDFDLLQQTFARYAGLLATPGVFAEVSNLVGNMHDRVAPTMRLVYHPFEERTVGFQQVLADRAFPRLGFADCAIAQVAGPDVHVLTDDVHLYSELAYRGLSVTNFNHLRSGSMID
jgi:hypothetical protein